MCCMARLIVSGVLLSLALPAEAQTMPAKNSSAHHASAHHSAAQNSSIQNSKAPSDPKQVEITADQSLDWYQDQQLYVARVNAKAVRGEMVVEADTLSAHQRDKPNTVKGENPVTSKPKKNENGTGDIDTMTADGHVRITDPRQRVTGDHAVYDLDKHVMVVTGNNLKYETDKEVVTARDSMEYWEDKKVAVARGNAVGVKGDRHVEGDVLTSEFRDQPNGSTALWKMTADGHVTIITKGDVSRGDSAVYDASREIAILRGNVRITRADGTQLTGDVGEVDFTTNQSRLMNDGTHRVRALLGTKSTSKSSSATPSAASPEGANP